jgi:hypothetical protein
MQGTQHHTIALQLFHHMGLLCGYCSAFSACLRAQHCRLAAPRLAHPASCLCDPLQVVVDRMFSRVLVCAGLPVATGVLLFPLFWYLKVSSLLFVSW